MAGSFTIAYTGGSASYGTYNGPYSLNTSTNQYGGGIQFSGTCGGQITATLTWQPNGTLQSDPPPTVVIIEQYSYAMWEGTPWPFPGTGTCDDGLGDSTVTGTNGVFDTNVSQGTHYKVDTSGNASIPVTCTPTATYVYAGGGLGAPNVEYEVTAYPVQIVPTGTTPDSLTVGQKDILIGQQCGASLSGIPSGYTIAEEDWSVTGTTFTGWDTTSLPVTDPTKTSYAPVLKPVVINSIPQVPSLTPWYWDDPKNNTTETITCKLTLTPPTGQTAPPPITLTSHANVMVPTPFAYGTAGYMAMNNATGNYRLYAVPNPDDAKAGDPSGMLWTVKVSTPKLPAFGNGTFELIQTVNPSNTVYESTAPTTLVKDPNNGKVCLDKSNPYGEVWVEPGAMQDDDSPGLDLTTLVGATSAASFVDYLMYQPPSAGNNPVTFVPIAEMNWNTHGIVATPTTGTGNSTTYLPWASWIGTGTPSDYVGAVNITGLPSGYFYPSSSFPSWVTVDAGWHIYQ